MSEGQVRRHRPLPAAPSDRLSEIVTSVARLVDAVRKDERRIGVFSTGEQLAVALVLDRKDLLDGYTMLEAVERLGPEWTRAARVVQQAYRS